MALVDSLFTRFFFTKHNGDGIFRRGEGPQHAREGTMTTAARRGVSAFVSTDWLQQNLHDRTIVVIDIRPVDQYKGGHVPGAVSSPFGLWTVERNGVLLELPDEDDLMDLIGSLGIGKDTIVIVVNTCDGSYSRADATRVALTLTMAGLRNAAVLEGGYAKWVEELKPVSTEGASPGKETYKGRIDGSLLATKQYVTSRIGKAIIVDHRDAGVYFGTEIEPHASRPGHIRTAVNLPTPWFYTKEGTLLPEEKLEAMAAGVVGRDKSKEIICYCGLGGYGSTGWFILTQMLGYRNVKFYDGAAQEWTMDPDAPMTVYEWS
jgi:thiosulfate/3-mercaptopyruvate sulfurtransferase